MTGENAVVVRGAYKRYGPKGIVLRGLNMTVPQGSVYGFLGPSGCGKTTLLSCIVGRSKLDAGSIEINVKSRSNIGYMPQELALHKELSIAETIAYYASLHGISWSDLKKRKQELYTFLDLPDEDSIIGECSGGQQRRVSLCVALLHNPQMLILDEPTCGVDPLLSQNIWEHLLHMSSVYKKTIIITTHYIEEAKQAHRIGMMRGGILLDEHEPNQLMLKHNCDTLEQTFLLLSTKQSNVENKGKKHLSVSSKGAFPLLQTSVFLPPNQIIHDLAIDYPKVDKRPPSPIKDRNTISMNHISSYIIKSIYWLKRNTAILTFLLLLPIVQCTLFNYTVGRDPIGLKIGVVNEEFSGLSTDCFRFSNNSCSPGFPLSCNFLKVLKRKNLEIVDYPDDIQAREGVEKNYVWGYIHFSKNYSDALFDRLAFNLQTDYINAENSEVNIWMDMSNQYIGNLIRKDIYFGFLEFMKKVFIECEWPVDASDVPIRYEPAVYGTIEPKYSDFAVPAVLQLFEFYLPMMFTVGAILMEKREGMLERSLINGMSLPETLIGHAIVQFSILAVQTLFMMIVLFVIFDNTIKGSITLALSLLFLVGISGMCYGYLVSAICDTDQMATYMGLGSFFPLSMLSGMVWPFEGMHYLLRAVGLFLPLTLTTDAFRAISTRAWSISHPVVYAGFISSVGWICFFCFATYIVVLFKGGIRAKT